MKQIKSITKQILKNVFFYFNYLKARSDPYKLVTKLIFFLVSLLCSFLNNSLMNFELIRLMNAICYVNSISYEFSFTRQYLGQPFCIFPAHRTKSHVLRCVFSNI